MTELERIAKLEKKLKVRKRKALAKEYEKLGRKFYKQSHAQSMSTAEDMLTHMPLSSHQVPTLRTCLVSFKNYLQEGQYAPVQRISCTICLVAH